MRRDSHKSGKGFFGDAVLPRRAAERLDPERRKDAILALLWVNQRLRECETDPVTWRLRIECLTRERFRLETALGSEGAARL